LDTAVLVSRFEGAKREQSAQAQRTAQREGVLLAVEGWLASEISVDG
jgi:hypothetical protein